MHLINEGSAVYAEVYEGALGRCRDDFDRGSDGTEEDIESKELNVFARARFLFLRCEGAWRLQSVESGEFSLIINVTPICNPDMARVRPGPVGSHAVSGSHWDRALKMRRQRRLDPHRVRLPKMKPFKRVGSQAPPLRLMQMPDWNPAPPKTLASSKSEPMLPRLASKPGDRDVTVRWREDASELGFQTRLLASASEPALQSGRPRQLSDSPSVFDRSQKRQARVAAVSPANRRELLFGGPLSPNRLNSTLMSGVPFRTRVQALETHLLSNDADAVAEAKRQRRTEQEAEMYEATRKYERNLLKVLM
jgi:hypothetical protein